jgi:hypothetical protein
MASFTSGAPAIPDEELLPSLQKYCFNEWMIWILRREPGFEELQYRSHPIYIVADFVRETAGQELSVNQFARNFECHPAGVKVALANGLEEPKSRGQHSAFDDDSEGEILTWIEVQTKKYRPMTHTYLRHYCQTKYSRPVTRGWIDSFSLRHGDDLTEAKITSQEDTRLEVLRAFLDEMVRCLREYVQGMKAELIFNLDEVGMSELENRKDKKVMVPKTMDSRTIHYRASRNVKHISIITCIGAGEKYWRLTSWHRRTPIPFTWGWRIAPFVWILISCCDNDRNRISVVSFSRSILIVSLSLTLTSHGTRKNSQDAKLYFWWTIIHLI